MIHLLNGWEKSAITVYEVHYESIKSHTSSLVNKPRATLIIDFEMMQKPKKIASSLCLFLSYYSPSCDMEIFPFYIVRPSTSSLLSLVIVTRNVFELAPAHHFFVARIPRAGHASFAIDSFSEKGSQLHFDGIRITFADANKCRRISGPRRRPKVEKKMRRDGKEADVRAAVVRLFIVAYAARSLAMQTCTYVVITSSHLRRSHTRIFTIDKSYATAGREPIRSRRRSVSIAVGRSFSAAGADRSFPPRCCDSSRLITCSTV